MLVSAGLVVEVGYTGVDVSAWLASVQGATPVIASTLVAHVTLSAWAIVRASG